MITGLDEAAVESEFVNARGYGDLKSRVAEVVIEALTPIRERYESLMQDVGALDRLLELGAERAESVAGPKLDEIKQRMGLILRSK